MLLMCSDTIDGGLRFASELTTSRDKRLYLFFKVFFSVFIFVFHGLKMSLDEEFFITYCVFIPLLLLSTNNIILTFAPDS